ncbi:hypothetical protein DO72_1771 [Burkholderia pseudomallei]|nr:hypothetical protein DO72_1771 [Burkholderia pseudomallei]
MSVKCSESMQEQPNQSDRYRLSRPTTEDSMPVRRAMGAPLVRRERPPPRLVG